MKNKSSIFPLAFLLLYFMVSNLIVFLLPVDIFSVSQAEPINSVSYLESTAKTPQDIPSTQWQSTQLPDFWYSKHKDAESIWYRSKLNVNSTLADVWAIYLPSVTHNATVYINGQWVGQGGSLSAQMSRHHNQPLLFQFSKKVLNNGNNQIDIRVQAASYTQGVMDQFYLAPVNQLMDAYEWKHALRVDYVQWITWFMYVVAIIVLIFWMYRPQDVIYGLYALQLVLWATHNLNLFVNEIPISARLWEAMNMATLGWTVVVMIMFNHRYVGNGNLKVERFMLLFSLLGMGIFFLPDLNTVLLIGYRIWDFFVLLFGIYALYYLIHCYREKPNQDVYLMMLAGIPILALGLHDIMVINHMIDRRDGMTMQFSIMPIIILFSWFLMRRFLQSINEAEQLAATLERRVEEKQLSLEKQYKQLNEFEKQGVLTKERERIMRDMHDGIGGQLISIVTLLAEHDEKILVKIRRKIKHSIGDLRFVIDSLDPLLNDLPTLLGTMRIRLAEQLLGANIELVWGITDLPEVEALTPSQSLHIMRIVQEAVTNSIKHSATTKLTIATGELEQNDISNKQCLIYVDIIDYGHGDATMDQAVLTTSRGLSNMKYRAEKMNANLDVSFLNSGTTVRLVLKMNRRGEA